MARRTNAYTVESDRGPLLRRAFPERHAPGQPLTAAQRRFLSAIVDNDACWGGIANPILWFRRTGLPDQRDPLRALVSGSFAAG